jgi:hypothetical protein
VIQVIAAVITLNPSSASSGASHRSAGSCTTTSPNPRVEIATIET